MKEHQCPLITSRITKSVTGKKREDAFPAEVVAKVVTAPAKAEPKKTAARTKAPKVAPVPVAETA